MTYGTTPWKKHILFSEFRTCIKFPFIIICLLVLVVFLLSASYFSPLDTPIVGQFQPIQYEVFKNACVERTTAAPNVVKVKLEDNRRVNQSLQKNYTETHGKIKQNATKLFRNTTKSNTNITGFMWNDTRLDILSMKLPPFDKRFKNPCWYEPLEDPAPYEENVFTTYSSSARLVLNGLASRLEDIFFEEDSPKRLRCLPYFLMIGQPKCGSTDLFWKIAKHGDVLAPPIKELHWWSRNRQGRRFSYKKLIPIEDYIDMFDEAAFTIEDKTTPELGTKSKSHQPITGEASVSLFWDNSDWQKFPENGNQSEPLYIIPHYIHHIIPDVKLILMFRDPVERLYSDYLYFNSKNKSADDFHKAVSYAVGVYHNCTMKHSLRSCIYNLSVANRVRVRLRVGLYSVYLKDWLKVFPLEQFYILRLEDYTQDQLGYIKKIHRFLGLRQITEEEADDIVDHANYNARKPSDRELGGMHDKTRTLLQKFYGPYNEDLASILGDTRFLWNDTEWTDTYTTVATTTTTES